MTRASRVDALYTRIGHIADREAFRELLKGERDIDVLGDLRERFTKGSGDKPWQVVEINREITAIRDARGRGSATTAVTPSPSGFKQRFDDHPLVGGLTLLTLGFLAGIGVQEGALRLIDYTRVSNERLRRLEDDIKTKDDKIRALEASRQAAAATPARRSASEVLSVPAVSSPGTSSVTTNTPPAGPTTAASKCKGSAFSDACFEFESARVDGARLEVTVWVTNYAEDRELWLGYSGSSVVELTDENGHPVRARRVLIGGRSNHESLVRDTRTPIRMVFEGLPTMSGEVASRRIRRLRLNMDIGTSKKYDRGFVDLRDLVIQRS